jgi:hypothetical protein
VVFRFNKVYRCSTVFTRNRRRSVPRSEADMRPGSKTKEEARSVLTWRRGPGRVGLGLELANIVIKSSMIVQTAIVRLNPSH